MKMNSPELIFEADAKELIRNSVKLNVQVQLKNMWKVRFGLFLIRIGCHLSGVQYVNEFPMSLIQNDKEVEME